MMPPSLRNSLEIKQMRPRTPMTVCLSSRRQTVMRKRIVMRKSQTKLLTTPMILKIALSRQRKKALRRQRMKKRTLRRQRMKRRILNEDEEDGLESSSEDPVDDSELDDTSELSFFNVLV